MNELYFLGQLVIAVVLGGILGIQRERQGKSAGPRTYGVVTAGATLATILAITVFNTPSIVSGILTGIGFLGAGLILHRSQDNHVEGLTTAAGLWMTATIGIAVGIRYYILAVGATLLILLLFMLNDRRFKSK